MRDVEGDDVGEGEDEDEYDNAEDEVEVVS